MRTCVSLFLRVVSFLVIAVASHGLALGQVGDRLQPTSPSIDGAKEPHKIPDEIAALMLFRTIADGPSAASYNTRIAFLKGSAFTDEELRTLVDVATQAVYGIRGAEAEAKTRRYQMDEEQYVRTLRSGRDRIVRDALQRLDLRLSPAVANRLKQHIAEHVKSRILVFGPPK